MDQEISPRETALKILYDIEKKQAYANIALKKYLGSMDYKVVDRGFITELVYGIIKHKRTLDYIINKFSNIKMKKITPWILNILRIGAYQILYLDKVPDSAACNESVKLAKRYGHHGSVKFVNGLLRTISRKKENIDFPNPNTQPIKYLEVFYSYPEWMIKDWIENYGYEFTESLCKANNDIPALCVRVNTLNTNSKELIETLKEDKVTALKGQYCEDALILKNVGNVENLSAFQQGLFQVQDESSMLVAKVLDPKPGEFILDVCCAPGGKATHIAQLMNDSGRVLGWDIHSHKIELVNASAKRLGVHIINAEKNDATKEDSSLYGRVDRVLVDAPCSGLGIIRRKPDIKWNKIKDELQELIILQKKILQISSKYVKPGGCLVYSTCTIQKEENINMIEDFLDENKEFQMCPIEDLLPVELREKSAKLGYIQLFPNLHNIDGFFMCKLQRKR